METIVANIETDINLDDESRRQQITEVEDTYLTGNDREQLDKFRRGIGALYYTETDVERAIFMIDCHLQFAHRLS